MSNKNTMSIRNDESSQKNKLRYVRKTNKPFPSPNVSVLAVPTSPIKKISIDELIPSDFCKNIYNLDASEDLVESIRMNGLLVPIWVTTKNKINSGHRRVAVFKKLKIENISAQIVDDLNELSIES